MRFTARIMALAGVAFAFAGTGASAGDFYGPGYGYDGVIGAPGFGGGGYRAAYSAADVYTNAGSVFGGYGANYGYGGPVIYDRSWQRSYVVPHTSYQPYVRTHYVPVTQYQPVQTMHYRPVTTFQVIRKRCHCETEY